MGEQPKPVRSPLSRPSPGTHMTTSRKHTSCPFIGSVDLKILIAGPMAWCVCIYIEFHWWMHCKYMFSMFSAFSPELFCSLLRCFCALHGHGQCLSGPFTLHASAFFLCYFCSALSRSLLVPLPRTSCICGSLTSFFFFLPAAHAQRLQSS